MDDSTRPRSVLRFPGSTCRPRAALVLLPIVLAAAPLPAAIPVGPFCGDLETSASSETGSMTADATASSCTDAKTCPGSSGPNVPYVANTFTNDTGTDACITVSGSTTCTGGNSVRFVAYLGSFDPSNICTNYLADSGSAVVTGETADFSFVVPNNATFVVVASETSPGADCGAFCFTMSSVACAITCPDNITAGTGPGATQCGTNVPFDVTDPCDSTAPSCVDGSNNPVASGDFFPVGTTTVTCSQGGAQCSFDITVNDTTPPVLTCPAPTSVAANGSCQGTVPNVLGGVTVTDNCSTSGNIQLSQSPTAGTIVGVGTTTITVTATDEAANQSTCTVDFTVNETQAPQITCPANITVSAASDACDAVVNFTTPAATDACNAATVHCVPASGSHFPVGQTTVTCTATNPGNSSQCTFTVTVNDTTAPTISCPADVVAFADPNGTSRKVTYPAPEIGDNCPGATSQCVPASGSTFPMGDTQVTCTATDAHQNTSQCTFMVSVRPNPIVPTLDPRALAALGAALAGIGVLLSRRR